MVVQDLGTWLGGYGSQMIFGDGSLVGRKTEASFWGTPTTGMEGGLGAADQAPETGPGNSY